jgi:lysophospholipase L1-like esterase
MWEKFCINKCENFVNLFPFFFDEKNKTSYLDVYKKYYNWNDTHFNKLANKVIANKLIYTLK